jgi:serpin B
VLGRTLGPEGDLADRERAVLIACGGLSTLRRQHPDALEGPTYEVSMMHQIFFSLDYATHAKQPLAAVALAYRGARSRAPSFVVVLPQRGHFESVAASFGEDDLAGLEWSRRRVELRLPRFELESRLSLTGALGILGIRAPFQKEVADFGALTDSSNGFFLSDVLQVARLRVDERGTEAAAASVMRVTGLDRDEPTPFHVDRPFLFFVCDRRTRGVLFAGRCTAPRPPGRSRGRA